MKLSTTGRSPLSKLLIAALFILISNFTIAQSVSVCTTSVNVGNFGMDGDLYANTPANIGGDDWFFSGQFQGAGIGVIGTTAATAVPPMNISAAAFKAIIQAGSNSTARNLTYQQRMSVPFGTVVNGYTMLDAVGARDNNAASAAADSSMFSGNSNKNGDNPMTWSPGIGSIPQKNDLTDVGGHIRRSNTTGELLGYAFATTRSTDGDAHTDFEIIRQTPVFNPFTGTVTNSGPASTGGHTAGMFNSNGQVIAPGDLILSIDYANGGTNPQASVRIWIKPNDVDGAGHDTAFVNSKAGRPFTFTGVFDSGNGANGYGYAEIRPNVVSVGSCLITSVINNSSTLGTPWGNIVGSSASYDDFLEQRQLVEVYINFSQFGLDINPQGGACFILFGNLIVKTRSSTSFTAELKDYAGPYRFGNFADIDANAGGDKQLSCKVTTVTLDGSSTTPGATFSWVASNGGHIVSGANTATPTVDAPGTYTVTTTNPFVTACTASDVVVVGMNDATPGLQCGNGASLNCNTGSAQLCASVTANSTYSWSGPGIVGSATGSCITVNAAGNYTVVATNVSSGCTESCTIVVSSDQSSPELQCPANGMLGCDLVSTNICVQSANGVTFSWTGPGVVGSSTGSCVIVNQPGFYTVVATKTSSGCTQSCTVEVVIVQGDCDEHCTRTQGFFGNGGKLCDGRTAPEAIADFLAQGPLVIGDGGSTVTFLPGDGQCLNDKLPSGTTPGPLPVGNVTCSQTTSNPLYLKNSRYITVLFGQTIVLGLNMRMDVTLTVVTLDGKYLTTIAADDCVDGQPVPGTDKTWEIPESVLNYLGNNNTITDLFVLANKALGGTYVPSGSNPSYSDINKAVTAINEGFDNCRLLVGFTSSAPRLHQLLSVNPGIIAYPNPFRDMAMLDITTDKDLDDMTMELYNANGELVLSTNSGALRTHQIYEWKIDGSSLPAGVYFYKVSAGEDHNHGRLVLIKD